MEVRIYSKSINKQHARWNVSFSLDQYGKHDRKIVMSRDPLKGTASLQFFKWPFKWLGGFTQQPRGRARPVRSRRGKPPLAPLTASQKPRAALETNHELHRRRKRGGNELAAIRVATQVATRESRRAVTRPCDWAGASAQWSHSGMAGWQSRRRSSTAQTMTCRR